MNELFNKVTLPEPYKYLAPDGSEIRLLAEAAGGSLCHCTLPAGKTSKAVQHRTVEEIWYIISGNGEMWQSRDNNAQIVPLNPGTSVTIPTGNSFQFRNVGNEPLCILIATIPKWPGEEEAVPANGHWNKITQEV